MPFPRGAADRGPRPTAVGALRAATGALLAALALAAGAAAPVIDANAPIQLEARSSTFDYRNSTLVFSSVRISQGALSVEADEAVATGLDFADSRWTFRGRVRVRTADAQVASDTADVRFRNNQIASATIVGEPATFEQKTADGLARGRAGRIEYDFVAGTVRLAGGAWLSDGTNEINGRTLVYSMRDQRVLASAAEQGEERVRITINPKKPAEPAKP